MVVRWAIEDRPVSHQLTFGTLAALVIFGIVAVAASGG
jgi:hypothetical protein